MGGGACKPKSPSSATVRRAQRLCETQRVPPQTWRNLPAYLCILFPNPRSYNICFPRSFLPNLLALFRAFFFFLFHLFCSPPAVVICCILDCFLYVLIMAKIVPCYLISRTRWPPWLHILHEFGSVKCITEHLLFGSICLSNLGNITSEANLSFDVAAVECKTLLKWFLLSNSMKNTCQLWCPAAKWGIGAQGSSSHMCEYVRHNYGPLAGLVVQWFVLIPVFILLIWNGLLRIIV